MYDTHRLLGQSLFFRSCSPIWVSTLCTSIVFACVVPAWACNDCGCDRIDGAVSTPHAHEGSAHDHGASITSFGTGTTVSTAAAPVSFIVMGDTEINVGDGKLASMMPAVTALNPDFVVFPGDLVTDGGLAEWQDWEQQTSVLGNDRFMVPGNHDVGPGGSVANWQTTFNWLPDSQMLNGIKGTDKIDYFVDRGNVRIVSIATDIPGEYSSGVPRAQAWFREVMKDVADRNDDADPNNNIDRVFAFSHKPITLEAGTGNGWWETLSGQDGSGGAAATAHLSGHWMLYQNSRPDPDTDTAEIVQGTSNTWFEGPAHRNLRGFTHITVNGGDVTTRYYGDPDGPTGGWNYQLVDTDQLLVGGAVPRGEQAFYEFESGITNQDSSTSSLSKGHELHFFNGAAAFNDAQRGSVLDLTSASAYADAKNIGEGNLAIVGDLSLEVAAKVNGPLSGVDNVLVSFGRSVGSNNGSIDSSREAGNYAYILAINPDGTLRLEWEHEGRVSESVNSTVAVSNVNQWNEFKVVRDHDTSSVQFSVDGVQLGQTVAYTQSASGAGAASLYLGTKADEGGFFNGWIDDVRISNVADLISAYDLNADTFINSADWLLFVGNLGATNPSQGDFNGDSIANHADFILFKQAFEDANGIGAFADMLAQVPEPCSATLLALGLVTALTTHRGTRCRCFRGC